MEGSRRTRAFIAIKVPVTLIAGKHISKVAAARLLLLVPILKAVNGGDSSNKKLFITKEFKHNHIGGPS